MVPGVFGKKERVLKGVGRGKKASDSYETTKVRRKFQDEYVETEYDSLSESIRHICKLCRQESKTFQHTAEHILAKHLDVGTKFECSQCNQKVKTRRTLIRHVLKEHGVSLNMFSIDIPRWPLAN